MTQQLATDLHRLAQNLYDLLADGVPEDVHQLVQFVKHFHKYSLRNVLLIWLQKPDATMVAGYRTWKKVGRYVRKGEKGIRIWAPKIVKITRTIVDEEGEVREVEEERLVGFRPAYVWDVSQTDGEPIPDLAPPELHATSSVDVFAWASAVERALGVTVVFTPLPENVNGVYDPATRRITVASNRNIAQQAKTLLHEAAHAMLHNCPEGDAEQERRFELEAEAAAALAATLLGIEGAVTRAWHYISTHYDADNEKAAKDFVAQMNRIIKTAETLFNIVVTQVQAASEAA